MFSIIFLINRVLLSFFGVLVLIGTICDVIITASKPTVQTHPSIVISDADGATVKSTVNLVPTTSDTKSQVQIPGEQTILRIIRFTVTVLLKIPEQSGKLPPVVTKIK